MKCERCRSAIAANADSEIGIDAETARHIAECEPCREQMSCAQGLEQRLRAKSDSSFQMPMELRASIMNAAAELHRGRARSTVSTFFKVALGCAAVLMLIAAVMTIDFSRTSLTSDLNHEPQSMFGPTLTDSIKGGRAIFTATDLATRALSEEVAHLKDDILGVAERYNRFLEAHLFLVSNDLPASP